MNCASRPIERLYACRRALPDYQRPSAVRCLSPRPLPTVTFTVLRPTDGGECPVCASAAAVRSDPRPATRRKHRTGLDVTIATLRHWRWLTDGVRPRKIPHPHKALVPEWPSVCR